LGYAIQFARKEQVKDGKKTASEPSARPFIPRGGFLGDTVLESDLPTCPALESGVTLLFIRFLERDGDKCRDREVLG